MNQVSRSALSFCIKFAGVMVGCLGLLLFKGIPILVMMAVLLGLENNITDEGWRWILGIFLFWVTLGFVSWRVGSLFGGWSGRIADYGSTFQKNYSKLYGEDFKHPTFEEFELMKEEYYAYNHRFQLDLLGMLLTWGTLLGTMYLISRYIPERNFTTMTKVLVPAALAGTSVHLIVKGINYQLSKCWPQYEKVKRYEEARNIYNKIEEETRERKIKEKYQERPG